MITASARIVARPTTDPRCGRATVLLMAADSPVWRTVVDSSIPSRIVIVVDSSSVSAFVVDMASTMPNVVVGTPVCPDADAKVLAGSRAAAGPFLGTVGRWL